MTAQYNYIPARASLLDYRVVPARPAFYAPAALSFNRWSAYYGQPRTTLAPAKIGLAGLGACCSSCAAGGPCEACPQAGVGGLYSSFQDSTSGYGMPVLVGAGIGYLTEKKTGAVVGGLLGAFFRWAWGQAEPTVMPIVEAVTPAGTAGFTDEFAWNPTMGEGDTTMDRAAFRTLQLIFLVGATTLALKVGKTVMARKSNSSRRNGKKTIAVGDHVRDRDGDQGRVTGIEGDVAWVAWDAPPQGPFLTTRRSVKSLRRSAALGVNLASRGRNGKKNPKTSGWGSANAEDLFKVATRLAGFDARELMLEIHRRLRGRDALVNERTVLAAMHTISQRAKQDRSAR